MIINLPENSELNKFFEFTKSIISELKQQNSLNFYKENRINLIDSGSWESGTVTVFSFPRLIGGIGAFDSLYEKKEVANLILTLWDKHIVRFSYDFENDKKRIFFFLTEIISALINEKAIHKSIKSRLVKSFFTSYLKKVRNQCPRAIAPLLCLKLSNNLKEFKFSHNLALKQFSNDERNSYFNRINSSFFVFDASDFVGISCYIESLDAEEKTSSTIIADLITAFRLNAESNVSIIKVSFHNKLGFVHCIRNAGNSSSYKKNGFTIFNKRDLNKVKRIYDLLQDLKIHNNYEAFLLALDRLNSSYLKQKTEDTILDLAICLESSILFGFDMELQYRLNMRCNCLLNSFEKGYTLLDLYKIRSKIVHNGKKIQDLFKNNSVYLDKYGNVKKFVECARQITREILLKMISKMVEDNISMKKLIEEIDKKIDCRVSGKKCK